MPPDGNVRQVPAGSRQAGTWRWFAACADPSARGDGGRTEQPLIRWRSAAAVAAAGTVGATHSTRYPLLENVVVVGGVGAVSCNLSANVFRFRRLILQATAVWEDESTNAIDVGRSPVSPL
jgi:hypothetical protein